MSRTFMRIVLALSVLGGLSACLGDDRDNGLGEEPIERRHDPASNFDACVDAAWDYSQLNNECFATTTTLDDVETVCDPEQRPDSVWPDCIAEVEALTACGERVGCDEWFTEACEDEILAQDACFQENATVPVPTEECGWTNDGECDEPEGTNLCPEGSDTADCSGETPSETASCDPTYCSGCDTACDEFGCYSCCYSCSGDSCEQSCNF